jgi:ketosteroid isomerase-like protein
MTTERNRRVLRNAFARLAEGDGRAFVGALADDVRWTIRGSTAWSGTYAGRPAVLFGLLEPLFAQFTDPPYRATADLILADGDHVVVLARGAATTHAGARYDNEYCYVCRLEGEKIVELVEYLDTAHVEAMLPRPLIR